MKEKKSEGLLSQLANKVKSQALEAGQGLIEDTKAEAERLVSDTKQRAKETAEGLVNSAQERVTSTVEGVMDNVQQQVESTTNQLVSKAQEQVAGKAEEAINLVGERALGGAVEQVDALTKGLGGKKLTKRTSSQVSKNLVKTSGNLAKSAAAMATGAQALKEIHQHYTEYQITVEQETTKRSAIEAKRQIDLAEIESKREFFMSFLDQSFGERKDVFGKFFEVVDSALDDDDPVKLKMALDGILETAKSSPFGHLVDIQQTQQALEDEEFVWKI